MDGEMLVKMREYVVIESQRLIVGSGDGPISVCGGGWWSYWCVWWWCMVVVVIDVRKEVSYLR